jgi:hypothetical protein
MCIGQVIGLRSSRFSCFCPKFKKWGRGDRSHASLVPVAGRRPEVVSAMEVLGASSTPHGVANIEVSDADPSLVIGAGACCRIWWCVVPVQALPGVLPRVM